MLAVDNTLSQFGERPDGWPNNRFRSALRNLRNEAGLPEETDRKVKKLRNAFNRTANDDYSIEDLIYDFERILE